MGLAGNLSGALWQQGRNRKESLQLRHWNLFPPPIPRWLTIDWAVEFPSISAKRKRAWIQTITEKHMKARAKGNDFITNVISANQHFTSTFSMQIFKLQRHGCKLSFLFPLRRQSAPESLLASYNRVYVLSGLNVRAFFPQGQNKLSVIMRCPC